MKVPSCSSYPPPCTHGGSPGQVSSYHAATHNGCGTNSRIVSLMKVRGSFSPGSLSQREAVWHDEAEERVRDFRGRFTD